METNHLILGKFVRVYKPLTYHLILWPLLALGPLLLLVFVSLISLNDFSQGRKDTLTTFLPCAGIAAIVLVVIAVIWLSDFKAWHRTRSIRIMLYEKGFIYSDAQNSEVCEWSQIEHLHYQYVPTYSSAFPGSKIKVIESAVSKTGKAIKFPTTLPLQKITQVFKAYMGD